MYLKVYEKNVFVLIIKSYFLKNTCEENIKSLERYIKDILCVAWFWQFLVIQTYVEDFVAGNFIKHEW